MSKQGPWPGRFVWHDLVTPDAARSRLFYGKLFGWRIEPQAMGGRVYHRLSSGSDAIGGMLEERGNPHAHWLPYIAVDNVDAAADRCRQLGGKVRVRPADVPGVGRTAVLGDPQGALIALFCGAGDHHGSDPDRPLPGRVCWNEVMTANPSRSQEFYSALFGWQDDPKDMGSTGIYHRQMLGMRQVCGIMKNPKSGAPNAWVAYFLVDDLARATDTAKVLGATAMMENAPIPEVGAFSLLNDPLGGTFALFQGAGDGGD